MRDAISLQRCLTLHPDIRQEAIDILNAAEAKFPANMAIRVAQAFRTWEEQDALYKQGRNGDKRPRVTNAPAGSSFHNYGLAIDFVILHDKDGNGTFEEVSWNTTLDFDKDRTADWQEVVASFESAGWEWGGKWRTFKDLPHVQKVFGKSIAWMRSQYAAKNFIVGTKYVKL